MVGTCPTVAEADGGGSGWLLPSCTVAFGRPKVAGGAPGTPGALLVVRETVGAPAAAGPVFSAMVGAGRGTDAEPAVLNGMVGAGAGGLGAPPGTVAVGGCGAEGAMGALGITALGVGAALGCGAALG